MQDATRSPIAARDKECYHTVAIQSDLNQFFNVGSSVDHALIIYHEYPAFSAGFSR